MNKGNFIGTTKNGIKVFDRQKSHIKTPVMPHLKDLLLNYEAKDLYISKEFLIPKIQMALNVIETTEDDDIFFAKMEGRRVNSRFVNTNREEKTDYLTVVLTKRDNCYIVIKAYAGKHAQKEPKDSNIRDAQERYNSTIYWENHAFVASKTKHIR